MNRKDRIREFVKQNFYVSGELDDEISLIEEGIFDSTGVLEVVRFIEQELDCPVSDAEILPENLDSIARIDRFVERKTAARAAVGA